MCSGGELSVLNVLTREALQFLGAQGLAVAQLD
jgi:hypothetical protein